MGHKLDGQRGSHARCAVGEAPPEAEATPCAAERVRTVERSLDHKREAAAADERILNAPVGRDGAVVSTCMQSGRSSRTHPQCTRSRWHAAQLCIACGRRCGS